MLGVALDGDDVDRFRLVRMDVDDEAEVGRQIAADLLPRVAAVVGPHDVPVLLHEQRVRLRRVHRDAMHAVPDFGRRIGHVLRVQARRCACPRPRGRCGHYSIVVNIFR